MTITQGHANCDRDECRKPRELDLTAAIAAGKSAFSESLRGDRGHDYLVDALEAAINAAAPLIVAATRAKVAESIEAYAQSLRQTGMAPRHVAAYITAATIARAIPTDHIGENK